MSDDKKPQSKGLHPFRPEMSNAIARKFFVHWCDNNDSGQPLCFFKDLRWDGNTCIGFWVDRNGNVAFEANMPSENMIAACRHAAIKFLRSLKEQTK